MKKLYILLAILMMAGCSSSANRDGSDDIGISSGTDSSSSTGVNSSSSGTDTNTSSVSSSGSTSTSTVVSDAESCKVFWQSPPTLLKKLETVDCNGYPYACTGMEDSVVNISLPDSINVSQNLGVSGDVGAYYWIGYVTLVADANCKAKVQLFFSSTDITILIVKYNDVALTL